MQNSLPNLSNDDSHGGSANPSQISTINSSTPPTNEYGNEKKKETLSNAPNTKVGMDISCITDVPSKLSQVSQPFSPPAPRVSRSSRGAKVKKWLELKPEDLTPPMPKASLPEAEKEAVQDLIDGEVFECTTGDPMTEYFNLLKGIDYKNKPKPKK